MKISFAFKLRKKRALVQQLLILILVFHVVTSCSQDELKLGKIVNITNNKTPYAEAMIAVDPTNNKNMGVVMMQGFVTENGRMRFETKCFITTDHGETWYNTELPVAPNQTSSTDPWISYSPDGTLYVNYSPSVSNKRGPNIAVHRSLDKGKTWDHTATIETLTNDQPQMTIDNEGNLYITTYGSDRDSILNIKKPEGNRAIIVATSTDRGEKFEVNGISTESKLFLGTYTTSIFSDGSVWLPFSEFSGAQEKVTSHIYGLDSFKKKIKRTSIVTELPRRFPSFVSVAVDKSNLFKDRLYVTYASGENDKRKIAFISSDDQGKTWSPPTILTNKIGGNNSRLQTIEVTKKGVIGVAWLQTESIDEKCWRVYFSYSKDGGKSFSDPIAVSDNMSCPNSEKNKSIGNGYMSQRFPYGGDYIGIDDTENGFQVVWTDLSTNLFQVFTRHLKVN